MRFLLFFSVCLFLLCPQIVLAADSKSALQQIKQQRAELSRQRKQLEAKLGTLGRSLKKIDRALVAASAEVRSAQAKVRHADQRLGELQQQQQELQQHIQYLKNRMRSEAALAFRQSGQSTMWLGMLFDAQVADIPHRQYLLARLVQQQQRNRVTMAESMAALHKTQQMLQAQRSELDALRKVKLARQADLKKARGEKQRLWRKVRQDARLKKQRDKQLARQEAALRALLKGLGSTLIASEKSLNQDAWKPMRKQKGQLAWPLKGRIVANFHSRPAPGRPRLSGVQLAPRKRGGQVKAIAAGQVRYADWFGGYGLMMIVDHGDGLMTVYAHNDALYKQIGDWVAVGDTLADAGSTGWVQDTRLYFEVRDAGKPVNPRRWCRKNG